MGRRGLVIDQRGVLDADLVAHDLEPAAGIVAQREGHAGQRGAVFAGGQRGNGGAIGSRFSGRRHDSTDGIRLVSNIGDVDRDVFGIAVAGLVGHGHSHDVGRGVLVVDVGTGRDDDVRAVHREVAGRVVDRPGEGFLTVLVDGNERIGANDLGAGSGVLVDIGGMNDVGRGFVGKRALVDVVAGDFVGNIVNGGVAGNACSGVQQVAGFVVDVSLVFSRLGELDNQLLTGDRAVGVLQAAEPVIETILLRRTAEDVDVKGRQEVFVGLIAAITDGVLIRAQPVLDRVDQRVLVGQFRIIGTEITERIGPERQAAAGVAIGFEAVRNAIENGLVQADDRADFRGLQQQRCRKVFIGSGGTAGGIELGNPQSLLAVGRLAPQNRFVILDDVIDCSHDQPFPVSCPEFAVPRTNPTSAESRYIPPLAKRDTAKCILMAILKLLYRQK